MLKKKLIKKSERLESFLGAADFFSQRASPYLDIGKDQKSFRSLVFELYSEKKIVGGASAKNSGFYNSEIMDFPQNESSPFCGKSKTVIKSSIFCGSAFNDSVLRI